MTEDLVHPSRLLVPWRPLFWEPVSGTGERIMVGVVHGFDGSWQAHRLIRDDVLHCLYGKAAKDVIALLTHSLNLFAAAADAVQGVGALEYSMGALSPGPARATEASSINDLLRTAALLYSSLAQIDVYDDGDENDTPLPDEVSRRFSVEVRQLVLAKNPGLAKGFGGGGRLTRGGQLVRFGYFSPDAIMHFSVLHPVRQSASVRDARAKLWELSRASEISGVRKTALIAAVPRSDEPHLGEKQRERLKANRSEIEREADDAEIRLHAVHSAEEGAEKVLALIG